MSVIINKIFVVSANRTEKNIKDNAAAILDDCLFYAAACANSKGDERREYLISNGFEWLYDKLGKPNDKGIAKPTMSGTMRNKANGMLFIAEHADQFIAWAETEEKTGVNSFTGIKTALKPKRENTGNGKNTGDGDGENTTGDGDGEKKTDTRSMAELYENFLMIWKKAGFGDSIAFAEYCATNEAGKIADKIDAKKAA